MTLFDLDTSFGKMSLEHSAPQMEKISGRSSRRLSISRTVPVMCLDLTPGAGNLLGLPFWGDQFSLAWRVLDAQYWGVAQRRRRIFLVADFGGLTAPKILFEQERLLGDPAEDQGQGKGVTTTAGNSSADSGGSRVAEEKQVDIFAFHINQREETINLNGISGALMATTNMQMQTFVAEGMRKFESAEKEEECLCLNDQGGERMDVSVDVTATLRADEWSSASGDGHPAGECWDRGNSGSSSYRGGRNRREQSADSV